MNGSVIDAELIQLKLWLNVFKIYTLFLGRFRKVAVLPSFEPNVDTVDFVHKCNEHKAHAQNSNIELPTNGTP